jgi:hypothetical protein
MFDSGVKVVRLTTLLGRLEWTATTSENSVSVPVYDKPSGIYLIDVVSETGRSTQYLVKP